MVYLFVDQKIVVVSREVAFGRPERAPLDSTRQKDNVLTVPSDREWQSRRTQSKGRDDPRVSYPSSLGTQLVEAQGGAIHA